MTKLNTSNIIKYLNQFPDDVINDHLKTTKTIINQIIALDAKQRGLDKEYTAFKEDVINNFYAIIKSKYPNLMPLDEFLNTIDSSTTTKTNNETSNKPKQPTNIKTVKRLLVGANIGDHYYSEKFLRKLPNELHTGDLVQEIDYYQVSNGGHIKIYDQQGSADTDNIQVYEKVKLEYDETLHHYVIRKYIDGSNIKHNDLPLIITLPDGNVPKECKSGDIVDYAFYVDQDHPFDKSYRHGSIRWTYPYTGSNMPNIKPTISQKIKQNKKSSNKPTVTNNSSNETLLDMNLTGHHIAIASSYHDAQKVVDKLAKKYQTTIDLIDTNNINHPTDTSYLNTLDKYDEIIIAIDYIRHEYQEPVTKYLNQTNHPYAISNEIKGVSIEKALYRAYHDLPHNDQSNINYVTK